MKPWLWKAKPWQAFKTFAILFSFTMNLVLLILLLLAAPAILPALSTVARPLVGGLNQSFIQMGEATITRTIDVEDTIPIQLNLPISSSTIVTLTESVPVSVPAQFTLPGGGGAIRGDVSLALPPGVPLPVQLELIVPVNEEIPVKMAVEVDIPMEETELGRPFANLQGLFAPLDRLLSNLPDDNQELFERLRARSPEPADAATASEP